MSVSSFLGDTNIRLNEDLNLVTEFDQCSDNLFIKVYLYDNPFWFAFTNVCSIFQFILDCIHGTSLADDQAC